MDSDFCGDRRPMDGPETAAARAAPPCQSGPTGAVPAPASGAGLDMTVHDRIIRPIRASVQEVFSTMLGLELEDGEARRETTPPQINEGIVSFIGLTGSWTGTGSLACSGAMACRLCGLMLATDFPAVNEEVLDAMAELTNMIVGNVKTDLEEHFGPLGLSIPTVIFGRNFKAKTGGHAEWSAVRFAWEDQPLLVRITLEPSRRAQLPPRYGYTCAVDV